MDDFKILIMHPGLQHAPSLVKELQSKYKQTFFITSCIFSNNSIIVSLLQNLKLPLKISNRVFDYLNFKNINCYYSCEIYGFLTKNIFIKNLLFQKIITSNKWITSDILIGFDTSSYHLLQNTKRKNQYFILDQTTPHYNLNVELNTKLNLEEGEKKSEKEIANEKSEYILSDYIVVASTFTKQSLINNGVDENKIHVIPYGVDLNKFPYKEKSFLNKMIFIYVGNVNKRKGINLLIDSWNSCKNQNGKELWIVGPISESIRSEYQNQKEIIFFGKVEHNNLVSFLHQANVFVFPSYFDGFGLVILEAMAAGLPIIASTNCGAPDLITNGYEGFIIDAGDKEQLTSRIDFFMDEPEQSLIMGKHARKTSENFTWASYGMKWIKLIESIKSK